MVIGIEQFIFIITCDLILLGILQIYLLKKYYNISSSFEGLLYNYLMHAFLVIPFFVVIIELSINADLIYRFLPSITVEINPLNGLIISFICTISIIYFWKILFNTTIKIIIDTKYSFFRFLAITVVLFQLSGMLLELLFENNSLYISAIESNNAKFNEYVLSIINNYEIKR